MSYRYIRIFLAILFFMAFIVYLMDSENRKSNNKDKGFSVKILQTVEHPALDATRRGIEDYLKECCNVAVNYETAQGSQELAKQIARGFISKNPDVVVAIGTQAAQALSWYHGNIPLVFSSVTDPVSAGLMKNIRVPNANVTGVSNMVPVEGQLELFKKILPNLKSLGMLYSPAEANSLELIRIIRRSVSNFGIQIISVPVYSGGDIISSAKQLTRDVDALFVSNDNITLSFLQGIVKIAEDAKKPVFCSDIDAINMGIVAAMGPNQYEIGIETGRIIERVLNRPLA